MGDEEKFPEGYLFTKVLAKRKRIVKRIGGTAVPFWVCTKC